MVINSGLPKAMAKVLVPVLVFLAQVAAMEGTWNTEDFLKRQHSLMKPYLSK